MSEWIKVRKLESPNPYRDEATTPYGAATLEKSHETAYGRQPKQEETFNEDSFPHETSNPAERHKDDKEYMNPGPFGIPGVDYETYLTVECSKHWITPCK